MTAVSLLSVAGRARAAGPLGFAIALAALGLSSAEVRAQAAQTPTSPTMACPDPNPPFVMPPEFVSSGRILKGTINLTERFIRLPTSVNAATPTCAPQLVRTFQGEYPPSAAADAAGGGRLCRSAARPDIAGACRRSGPAYLHQPGQFESVSIERRSRGGGVPQRVGPEQASEFL